MTQQSALEILSRKNRNLIEACENGDISGAKEAIAGGADVRKNGGDMMFLATRGKHGEIVKALIKAGADVHLLGDYPLLMASSIGDVGLVEFLLDAGADVHAGDDDALRVSSEYGHTGVVRALIEAGADVHAKGGRALSLAQQYGHDEVALLLENFRNPRSQGQGECQLQDLKTDVSRRHR